MRSTAFLSSAACCPHSLCRERRGHGCLRGYIGAAPAPPVSRPFPAKLALTPAELADTAADSRGNRSPVLRIAFRHAFLRAPLPAPRLAIPFVTPPPEYQNVHTVAERHHLRIRFPRLVQVVPDIQDKLDIDLDAIEPIRVTPRFDPTETYIELDLGVPHAGMGGQTQDRSRAYQNFRIQRLLFRVATGLIAPYKKPWLFPQALGIAEEVIRPISDGGKIKYEQGVDPREICNLRYLTVIRERLSAALRPGEGPERFLPALDEYQPIGSTDGLNFNSPNDLWS